jgi:hypothetical protein
MDRETGCQGTENQVEIPFSGRLSEHTILYGTAAARCRCRRNCGRARRQKKLSAAAARKKRSPRGAGRVASYQRCTSCSQLMAQRCMHDRKKPDLPMETEKKNLLRERSARVLARGYAAIPLLVKKFQGAEIEKVVWAYFGGRRELIRQWPPGAGPSRGGSK